MTRFIHNTVYAFFFVLMGIITYSLSRTFISTFFNYAWYTYILAALMIAGIFGLFILFFKRFDNLCKSVSSSVSRLSVCKLAVILGVVCLVTKVALIFVFNSDCNVHIDMGKYISFADQISHNGIVTEHCDYATYHSYTLVYGVFLSPIGYFFGTNSLAYEVFLAVLMTALMVLLFDILQKYAGKVTSFVGILAYNLIPMGLMQPQVVVHETPLLFFHVLALWLLLKIFDNKYKPITKVIFAIICAVSITIGTCLNVAGKVIMISFAIFSFVRIISAENKTSSIKKVIAKKGAQILAVALTFVVCLSMCNTITSACVDRFVANPPENNFKEKKISMGWGLYVGSNYETFGTISGKDKEVYNKYKEMDDVKDAKEYQLDLIKERYSYLLSSPKRIITLIYKKLAVLWSPYFAFRGNPESPGYQAFASMAGGIGRLAMLGITYLAYVIFYLMTLIGVYNKKERAKKEKSPILHFMMVPVGLTLALILFEALAKYSSHAHILIFAVGILNFSSFRANMSAIREKLLPKSKKLANNS
ncbi:MAG: hypothetical protein IJA62_04895 [Ruminococcus sp.]|nr:hypothetical protein [Ruminococcus sp.]